MKIINLKVNNFKGIKAIDITPQDETVIISGKNGAGKSSVLDSIFYALSYKTASKQMPEAVRNGEEESSITVDLGEYVVTRFDKWTSGNSYLEVTTKDGSVIKSPQSLLDTMMGKISFDPLELVRMKDEDRQNLLLDIGGVKEQVDKLRTEAEQVYSERTLIGRDRDNLQWTLKTFPEFINVPDKEVSVSELMTELNEAEANNVDYNTVQERITVIDNNISVHNEVIKRAEKQIEDTKKEIELANAKKEWLQQAQSTLKFIDTTEIKEKIQDSSVINDRVKQKKRQSEVNLQYMLKNAEYNQKSDRLNEIKQEKVELLSKIDLGLGQQIDLREGKLYIGDVPFEQLCFTERLKLSMIIAMKNDNKIRVIRVMDGGLIDTDNMEVIKGFAKQYDYQIWIEKVDDSGKVGFLIEDWTVVPNK